MIVYLLSAVLHLLCGVSLDHCGFLLAAVRLMLSLALSGSENLEAPAIINSTPRDPRTVLQILNLEPVCKSFVCCPGCFSTYDADRPYPVTCPHKTFPESEACGAKLQRKRKRGMNSKSIPAREFLMQDMQHWIARLYNRPGLEEILDNDVLSRSDVNEVQDIWDAPELRNFKGSNGKIFAAKKGNLIFSLNIDGFNPLGNKAAGKSVSTGGVYMVCLNLPPALRYKVENMFLVGVIPGPNEPSVDQINHILRPLVDALLVLWHDGVYLTQTPLNLRGRRIKCAVVPLVCDLPAARKIAGFGSYTSHHFCSHCHHTQPDINTLDYDSWRRRTYREHLEAANAWKDATAQKERETLFKQYGIRWSELLCLPYWDPTRYVIIDSMHCLYLGLARRHIREVWGMDVNIPDGPGVSFENKSMPGENEMIVARRIYGEGSNSELDSLRRRALVELCREVGLPLRGKRKALLKLLKDQVCNSY